MNLLFVVLSLDVGGLEKLVIQLISKLTEMGHEIKICCLEREGVLAEELKSKGIEI